MGVVTWTKGVTGRESYVLFGQHALDECQPVVTTLDARKRIEGTLRRLVVEKRMLAKGLIDQFTAALVLRLQLPHEALTLLECCNSAELCKHVGRCVETLRKSCPLKFVSPWRNNPANTPAGHGPGFGEAVDDHKGIVLLGNFQKRRCMGTIEYRTVVHLISDYQDPLITTECQQFLLLLPVHHPARWITG